MRGVSRGWWQEGQWSTTSCVSQPLAKKREKTSNLQQVQAELGSVRSETREISDRVLLMEEGEPLPSQIPSPTIAPAPAAAAALPPGPLTAIPKARAVCPTPPFSVIEAALANTLDVRDFWKLDPNRS